MNDFPFEALLLPGEKIIWATQSKPAPRSWLSGLGLVGVGLAVLALFGPRLWVLVLSCVQTGSVFPLQFIGIKGLLGMVLPVLLSVPPLWIAWGLLRHPPTFSYGQSATRVFIAAAGPARRWSSSSYILPGGTVEIAESKGFYSLNVPIRGGEDDTPFAAFDRLSKADFETGLAKVNAIIAAPAQ